MNVGDKKPIDRLSVGKVLNIVRIFLPILRIVLHIRISQTS